MLDNTQIKEIRSLLDKSKKPLVVFDDDPDGLTSYLLLKKKYNKCERLCLKASPTVMNSVICATVNKKKPDLVVFLDVPVLDQELIHEINRPIIWIDHHPPIKIENVNYYNPMNGKKPDNKPTSHCVYQVVRENEWLALVGIIADWQIPDKKLLEKFQFKELLGDIKGKTPPELIFDTEYGKLVKIWFFCMKGENETMNDCLDALEKIDSPLEILEQKTERGRLVYNYFQKLNKEYEALLNDALEQKEENIFVYVCKMGKNSYRALLSNELLYKTKCKVLIIANEKNGEVRMSFRSREDSAPILPILKKAVEKFNGYGGGHAHACGGAVSTDNFPEFIEYIKKEYD